MKLGKNLWMIGTAFAVVFAFTALLSDDAFVVPVILVMAIAGGLGLANTVLKRRRHAGGGAAAPHLDPVDDPTPLGDTPEAHDEISVHDLPIDQPGRGEAARQAGAGGVTRGDV